MKMSERLYVTPKQHKVILLVAENLSNAEIGVRLGNSQGAIEQVMVKLYKRLGVKSRAELKQLAGRVIVIDRRQGNAFRRGIR
jgi:DNA-binding CsgD family transcriptional regulator